MSWKDFDLYPRVVSGPPTYESKSANPVDAAPVHFNGQQIGFLATSVDPADNVLHLVIERMNDDYFNTYANVWVQYFRSGAAQNVPVHDMFRGLLGTSGPNGAGEVSTQIERFPNTDAVAERLNPGLEAMWAERRAAAKEAARRSASRMQPAPTRAEIDAVLRGRARPTPEIQARITALDDAIHAVRAPEDVLVALAYDPTDLPEGAMIGTVVHEPTYLTSTFLTNETTIDAPTMLVLHMTEGTPALYTPPEPGEPGAGTLLIARDIDWRITALQPGRIEGTIVASVRHARPLYRLIADHLLFGRAKRVRR